MESSILNGNTVIMLLAVSYAIIFTLAMLQGNSMRNRYLNQGKKHHSH